MKIENSFSSTFLSEREASSSKSLSLFLARCRPPPRALHRLRRSCSKPPGALEPRTKSRRFQKRYERWGEKERQMAFSIDLCSLTLFQQQKKKKLLVPLRRVGAPSRDHRRRLQALPGSALSQRGPGLRRLPLRGVHGRARRAARGFGLEGGRLGLSGRPRTTQACRARPGAGGGAVRGAGSGRGRGQGEGEAGGAGGGRREGSGDRERRRRRRGGREEKGEEMKKKCFLLRERENEEGCGCFLSLSLSLVTPSQVPQCAN